MIDRRLRNDWLWHLAAAFMIVTLLLSINAVKLGIGPLPLRGLTLIGALGAVTIVDPGALLKSVREAWRLLLIILCAAILGVIASMLNRADPAAVVQQVVEIHVQAILSVIGAYAIVTRFGPKVVLYGFLGAFGTSAIFALGQAAGLDAAWQARAMIGRLQGDPALTQDFYIRRYRALGLSYSPVLFGTQACVAIAAAYCLRLTARRNTGGGVDWILICAIALCSLLSIATGNRSPLLGVVIFLFVYGIARSPKAVAAGLPILLILGLGAQPMLSALDQAGVRVASTDDGSAEGRSTLQRYGLFLVGQRPYGYGLTFDSTEHWQQFYSKGRYLVNPNSIRKWPLHNYYLLIIAKYGLLSLALVALAVPRRRTDLQFWLAFTPYMVHIFYHNDGPLQADFLIFYVLAVVTWLARRAQPQADAAATRAPAASKPWRRAFAQKVV